MSEGEYMNIKTLILVIILLGMVAYGGYYLGNRNTPAPLSTQPTPTGTISSTPTPSINEAALLKTAIKQALGCEVREALQTT